MKSKVSRKEPNLVKPKTGSRKSEQTKLCTNKLKPAEKESGNSGNKSSQVMPKTSRNRSS